MKIVHVLSFSLLSLSSLAQVGIGTTSPSEILDLESSNASKTALDINNTGGGDPKINFQISGTSTFSMGIDNSDADKFKIGTSAVETNTRFTIDASGNVGINTSSPSSVFTVNGTSELYQELLVRGTLNSNTAQFRTYNDNTDTYIDFHGGSVYFRDQGSTNVFTLQDATGRVGIGCNNPQYTLHVVGDIAASNTVYTTNALVTGAISACSDFRYKTQITPMTNALQNIMKMQGVTYYWKTAEFPSKHFSNSLQIGVIAQEVEKVYPQLVFTDTDGYKAVDYSKFTPILLEAIKEQQLMIEQQKNELENQKKLMLELQASVNDLKKNQLVLNANK